MVRYMRLDVGDIRFLGHTVDAHCLGIVSLAETVIGVEHIRLAAGHTGTEIFSCHSEYKHLSIRHVFACMIADAFHNGKRAAVAYCKPFCRTAAGKEKSAGCAKENRVADNDVYRRNAMFRVPDR